MDYLAGVRVSAALQRLRRCASRPFLTIFLQRRLRRHHFFSGFSGLGPFFLGLVGVAPEKMKIQGGGFIRDPTQIFVKISGFWGAFFKNFRRLRRHSVHFFGACGAFFSRVLAPLVGSDTPHFFYRSGLCGVLGGLLLS